MSILVSLDPSFTRTGICIINLDTRQILFDTASCKIGEKQFENVVKAGQSIVQQLIEVFSGQGDDYDLITESPLPCSSMSPALYSLDTQIYNAFEQHIKRTYNPSTLRSKIHGHKYEKKDSMELADKYLKILEKCGYIIISDMGTKKKLVHDCAEAFLYCWLYLYENNHPDFQFDNADEIRAFKERKKELKKRHKELMSIKTDITI